ncbi:MAG: hypothetical protein PHQ20_01370 [Candidatus Moranbacteria bacterium]|nr:hypothetical protein [Candidatus Moranbacteria bacterium]
MAKKQSQTKSGQFRQKRGDTLVRNLEKKYGVDFGVRSDMKLETYLKKEGVPSLSEAVKKLKK